MNIRKKKQLVRLLKEYKQQLNQNEKYIETNFNYRGQKKSDRVRVRNSESNKHISIITRFTDQKLIRSIKKDIQVGLNRMGVKVGRDYDKLSHIRAGYSYAIMLVGVKDNDYSYKKVLDFLRKQK